MKRGFTLIELIIVIIIVGILAAVGLSQYSLLVEKSRVAEAKVRIGTMSKLAYQYYLENGTFVGLINSDVGVDATCHSTDYYYYLTWPGTATQIELGAARCTSGAGGKNPPGAAYVLDWVINSSGVVTQYAYKNSGGSWIITNNWGSCCR